MSSLAQDELGHAQALYRLLAEVLDDGRDADAIAYDRPARRVPPRAAARPRPGRLGEDDRPAVPLRHRRRRPAGGARRGRRTRRCASSSTRSAARSATTSCTSTAWLERLAAREGEPRERLARGTRRAGPDAGDRVHAARRRAGASSRPASLAAPMASSRPAGGRRSRRRSRASGSRCRPPTATRPTAGRRTASRSAGCGASSRSVRRDGPGGDVVIERPPGPTAAARPLPPSPRCPTRRSRSSSIVDLGMVERVDVEPTGDRGSSCCRRSSAARRSTLIRAAVAERLATFGRAGRGGVTFDVSVDVRPDHARRPATPPRRRASPRRRSRRDVRCPYCGSAAWHGQRLRPDPVPLALLLPRLPPAVRGVQADLTATTQSSSRMANEIVGVIGAGTMGAGIAQVALEAGHEVVLHDVDEAAIERGRARIREGLARRAAKLDSTPTDRRLGRRPAGRLRDAHTLDARRRRGGRRRSRPRSRTSTLKRDDLPRARRAIADPDAILATNTSALSVGAIAEATSRSGAGHRPALLQPGAAHGARRGRRTADRRIRPWSTEPRARRGLGQDPGPVADSPGFIVNRVNRPFTIEALRHARSRRGLGRSDRRGDARGRLPDGPVRAHGPRRGRRQPRRGAGRLGGPRSAGPTPAFADPGAAGRGRAARAQVGQGFYRYDDGRRGGVDDDFASAGPAPRPKRSVSGSSGRSPKRRFVPATTASPRRRHRACAQARRGPPPRALRRDLTARQARNGPDPTGTGAGVL